MTGGRTHWEGCWREHRDCATRRIEELEKKLADAEVWLSQPDDVPYLTSKSKAFEVSDPLTAAEVGEMWDKLWAKNRELGDQQQANIQLSQINAELREITAQLAKMNEGRQKCRVFVGQPAPAAEPPAIQPFPIDKTDEWESRVDMQKKQSLSAAEQDVVNECLEAYWHVDSMNHRERMLAALRHYDKRLRNLTSELYTVSFNSYSLSLAEASTRLLGQQGETVK
jgi:hypothetical protein